MGMEHKQINLPGAGGAAVGGGCVGAPVGGGGVGGPVGGGGVGCPVGGAGVPGLVHAPTCISSMAISDLHPLPHEASNESWKMYARICILVKIRLKFVLKLFIRQQGKSLKLVSSLTFSSFFLFLRTLYKLIKLKTTI